MTEWLYDRLRGFRDRTALIFDENVYSYRDLLAEIERYQEVFESENIHEGDVIVIIGETTPATIFLLVSLLFRRCIVVPLSGGLSPGQEQEAVEATFAKGAFRQTLESDGFTYTMCTPKGSHPLLDQLKGQHSSGLVIFTSGSTSKAKAALLSGNRLVRKYEQLDPKKAFRVVIFLKIDHIGGINTLLSSICQGGAIITPRDRSPKTIAESIETQKVELLPTTPTFLQMLVLSGLHKAYDFSSLKMITYGAEPMPESTLERVQEAFPRVRLKQTYGLTELGIFPTRSKDSASTWMQVGGDHVKTKIVDGILWIKSNMAMLGYLNAPSPFDDEGWFNTGDHVETNGSYLRIMGRGEEIINVGGENVYPAEVESVLMEISNIYEVVVRGKKNPVTGQVVTATCVLNAPEELASLRRRISAHCRGRLEQYKIPLLVSISETIAVSDRYKKIRLGGSEG